MSFGLTTEQAKESLAEYGSNNLTELERESFGHKFRGSFRDPMIRVLCVALAINIVFAFLGETEWYEAIGIALAVILATFVSTFSEYRNESAFRKLQDDASRILCKVYRDGGIAEISIGDIVVGDYVLLQTGDKIPADGLIVDGQIKVDQATLNGESKEATKSAITENYTEESGAIDFLHPHTVYRGAVVVSGNAVMKVTVVGDKSLYGQIASELQEETDRSSPLKVKLAQLARGISRFGYIGGIAIAVVMLFQNIIIKNHFDAAQIAAYCSDELQVVGDIVSAIVLAVIIIVMAVPEGLPLMIAIVSALNMGKMLKDNVLVRKVTGIETAGSLNILFSDKTGTITKGQLETVIFVDGTGGAFTSYDTVTPALKDLLHLSIAHNTTAIVNRTGDTVNIVGGNATERAVLAFVASSEKDLAVSVENAIPFSSEHKYSAASVAGDYQLTLIKGAPEIILRHCKTYYDENGEKQSLTDRAALNTKIDELAGRAIRVLAIATSGGMIEEDRLPDDEWTLVGVVGLRDDVRPESITAIQEVKNAGVQVVMITGDRIDTAIAIAKEAGLLEADNDLMITSQELAEMTDDEIQKALPRLRVVARALPSDKSRLVRIAQSLNLVVGMTGDGVNDSPALKKADVGFSMGGGTEVAKEASDIVILDDNFSSIDKAILYGRTIFNNIRKFIIFQLTINIATVMISFAAPLIGVEYPLTVIQILWVNLVMDTLAALAFGGEPALRRSMKEAPKRRDEPIVNKPMWGSILTGSIWIFFFSLVFLLTSLTDFVFDPAAPNAHDKLMTGYFGYFVFAAVFNAFNARTDKINLLDHLNENKGFLQVMGIIALVHVLLLYLGNSVFRCVNLSLPELLYVIGLAALIIPVDMIRKAISGALK
ncbi:calcium-translocating P-type ATPase, PMCA-type [Clostridia bacterium]|nr:calcium-translocating P-type ATPase, PMCA-type [Clostridia bacterium]